MFPQDQVDELRSVFDGVQKYEERDLVYFFIPKFSLPSFCTPSELDVLFCPCPRDGYPSRLYFSERVATTAQLSWNVNWTAETRIIDRNWFAYSWKVQEKLRLVQLLLYHARALG